jgi:Flp pilus assembly protein TadG
MTMRTKRARGIAVIATSIMLTILVPVMGLAIDVTLIYVDKARLQGAVDGAALAGAESLSRGATDSAQITAAKAAAAEYVFLNYPSRYFFTTSITVNQSTDVTVDETVANQRTVSVTGHAIIPTLFMRWLNFASTNLNAAATVTRKDLNVMLVMDRSGSLANSGSCGAVKAGATGFLNHFSLGTDNVGLITFASSSRVDGAPSTAFSGLSTIINSITCTGATSSAQALWTAYQALATLNQPGAMNAIVFFTDGQPTAVTAALPTTGGCNGNAALTGVFTVGFQTTSPFAPVATGGIFNYVATPQPMASDATLATGSGGAPNNCQYNSDWTTAVSDIKGVPTTDIWGNNLNNGYQTVTLASGLVSVSSDSTGALNMINASTNAADDAGHRIRTGANPSNGASALSNVIIFTIGLGNSTYPANGDLLERIANDLRASSYTSAQPAGIYSYAAGIADIQPAFAAVASEILRIAK